MGQSNFITMLGNLVADPEVRFTKTGKAVCSGSIASQTRVKVDGQWQDGEPNFIDWVAFDTLAENIAESLSKGTRVFMIGEINQSKWETDDGQKRSKHEIKVEAFGPDLRFATVDVTKAGGSSSKTQANDEEPF